MGVETNPDSPRGVLSYYGSTRLKYPMAVFALMRSEVTLRDGGNCFLNLHVR